MGLGEEGWKRLKLKIGRVRKKNIKKELKKYNTIQCNTIQLQLSL